MSFRKEPPSVIERLALVEMIFCGIAMVVVCVGWVWAR